MKLESLVIANQHVAVNTFPGLVHLSLIHISGYAKEGKMVSADAFVPEYLRPSQAERE